MAILDTTNYAQNKWGRIRQVTLDKSCHPQEAKAKEAEAQKAQPDDEEGGAKGMLEGSLDRVKDTMYK